jgi:hypothetical protein
LGEECNPLKNKKISNTKSLTFEFKTHSELPFIFGIVSVLINEVVSVLMLEQWIDDVVPYQIISRSQLQNSKIKIDYFNSYFAN